MEGWKMKKTLLAMMLVAGMQSAFAACLGTAYVKMPDTWPVAYVYYGVDTYKIPMTSGKNGAGFVEVDLGSLTSGVNFPDKGFALVNSTQLDMPLPQVIDKVEYDVAKSRGDFNSTLINCPGDGEVVYVSENPKKEGETVVGSMPPDSKHIYFMLPYDDAAWMGAVPMISADGGKTAVRMTADETRCGWFYYEFFGEPVTDSVLFMPDNAMDLEHAIGLDWAPGTGGAAKLVPLQSYFDDFKTNEIFFIPDPNLWLSEADHGVYSTDPLVEGVCSYSIGALIYDTDAKLHPSFSCDYSSTAGAFNEGCQKGVPSLGIDSATALTYVKNCIGVHQGIVVDTLGPDKKPHLSDSDNAKKCFPSADIFEMLFNYTEGVNEMSCYDLPFERNANGSWEFNSDYYISFGVEPEIPGGFYPVEKSDDDVILKAYPQQTPVADARTKRAAQGPVYMVPFMRQVDPSSGENMPRQDLVCNGPGWNRGRNCEGKYASGGDLTDWYPSRITGSTTDGVWCWGGYCAQEAPKGWPMYVEGTGNRASANDGMATPRWGTDNENVSSVVRRNQHFCFESHADFVYNPGQRFAFRGDDDIWVFIDNKLAVDLGGTHLAAPGYVVLDDFVGKSGRLVPGQRYDFDMFFCDRRTTMTNVRVYSNIFFEQRNKIEFKKSVNEAEGSSSFEVCVIDFHDKDCVSRLGPNPKMDTTCGKDVSPELVNASYSLMRADGKVVLTEDEMTEAKIYKGGIDLTNRLIPKINVEKMELEPGSYNLIVTIDGKTSKIPFTIEGDPDNAVKSSTSDDSGVDKKSSSSTKSGSKPGSSSSSSSAGKNSSSSVKDGGKGGGKKDVEEFANPSFRVVLTGPFTFSIVFNEDASKPGKTKKYAVMDLMGGIVEQGATRSSSASVSLRNAGSYIVRVGHDSRVVNVKMAEED